MSRRLPRRPGRRSALTPDVESRLLDAVTGGVPLVQAAAFAGVHPSTFHRWMQRAEEEQARRDAGLPPADAETPFVQLAEKVTRARATAAVRSVAVLQKAAQGGYKTRERTRTFRDADGRRVTETEVDYAPPEWRASAWLLERSYREFSKAHAVELAGPGGGPLQVEQRTTVDVTDLAARLQALAARRPELETADGEVILADDDHAAAS